MSIARLTALIPPPAHPLGTGSAEGWARAEDVLGTPLPPDYRQYVAVYGTGGFHLGDFTFLYPYSPFSADYNLRAAGGAAMSAYRSLRERFPGDYHYAAFPEPRGLLPWGRTDNGDDLYWLTRGEPAGWATVVSDGFAFEEFALPMIGFLAGWVGGEISPAAFPGRAGRPIVFRPHSDRVELAAA